jgi:IS30 family transposase
MTMIAAELGRNRSCLSDELKRCGNRQDYCPGRAQAHRDESKARSAANARRKPERMVREVRKRLEQDWSPEQISGRRQLLGHARYSTQAIYNLVQREGWQDKLRQTQMRAHLQRPARKPWSGSSPSVHERPREVLSRLTMGHWETDTMVGKRRDRQRVLVSVERQSLYVVLRRLPRPESPLTAQLIRQDLKEGGLPFLSVTHDRGSEFTAIGEELPNAAFACDAYQPNQRGTGENTIGLCRQYHPKGHSLAGIKQRQLKHEQDKLNHRPRKSLGYLTPHEVMFNCPPTVGTRT